VTVEEREVAIDLGRQDRAQRLAVLVALVRRICIVSAI